MKVAIVTSEVFPFSKTGGLGDVAGSLAKYLPEKGVKVSVISPLYKICLDKIEKLLENIITTHIHVKFPPQSTSGTKSSPRPPLPSTTQVTLVKGRFMEAEFIFVSHEVFNREGLYGEEGEDYPDNLARFFLLSRASIMAVLSGFTSKADVIHLNDWQSAPVALLAKKSHSGLMERLKAKPRGILLTVHNFAYQGAFPAEKCHQSSLPRSFCREEMNHSGNINLLKTGLLFADFINTVSPTYRDETLKSNEYSFGLTHMLQRKSEKYSGILNGADYSSWNPETDRFIFCNYSPGKDFNEARKIKEKNKKLFITKYLPEFAHALSCTEDLPLISMVARATYEKGFDILLDKIDRILSLPLLLVIVAKGDPQIEKRLSLIEARNFKFFPVFDEALAHRAIASADMFLMPSKFEPCGLTQMYSMKYATVPIVHLTGGLADTVTPYPHPEATGFGFSEYSGQALLNTVEVAVQIYKNRRSEFIALAKRGTTKDFSWERRIEDYVRLYRKIAGEGK